MAKKRNKVVSGATGQPDVADDYLADWQAHPLSTGFEIEDARLDSSADLSDADAAMGRIVRSRLVGVALTSSRLPSLVLMDVELNGIEASNSDWSGVSLTRVIFEDCRLTGLQAPEMRADDVVFRNCRLDLANFRFSTVRHVTFENCVLDEADFGGATIKETRMAACQLHDIDFNQATLSRLDLRSSELRIASGASGLRGAIVSSSQLIDLAALLAEAAGVVVDDD